MEKIKIEKPTLILEKDKVIKNIKQMTTKAKESDVRFRPHFKTHQSAEIGDWFKDFGINSITVSSVDMALYFTEYGWDDITVAFPINFREIDKINVLAEKINLHLLVESTEAVDFLNHNLNSMVNVWIKIDTGSKRTGIVWNDFEKLKNLAELIKKSNKLLFKGLLTHAGHTYKARNKKEIATIHKDSVTKMNKARSFLLSKSIPSVEVSIGDTPACSVVSKFSKIDEIRPGNFVFYDVMQYNIGSCLEDEIAVSIACPVIAKHKKRNEIVIYGGAVHLSKDSIIDKSGNEIFGYISYFDNGKRCKIIKKSYVCRLSQEHGIISVDDNTFENIKIGNIIAVLPVHSCLTVNLLKRYLTTEGEIINTMN